MKNNNIQEKKAILENAKIVLNKEFIGLESIITTIIDSISSWYLFPHIQDRPLIVNLWGLTGVGKSSLAIRLSQLIQFDNRYYRFDMGAGSDTSWDIRIKLNDIANNQNGQAMIIGFDEFQHAKSLDELQRELSETPHRIIWDLLDSGKFNTTKYSHAIGKLYNLKENLKYALHQGIMVENGFVTEQKEKFIDLMDIRHRITNIYNRDVAREYDTKNLLFVDTEYALDIYELWTERFNNEFEVRKELMIMDGEQSIAFIEKAIEFGLSPLEVDCSKALIFIMGNLDEAYHMSKDFNPDINANEFYEQSLKISISNIKQALRRRFRSEQIARLGNLHIIYPSFSQQSYYQLIELELNRLKKKHEDILGIKINFDSSINEIIYKEGVYPTQGIRPLLTTIHYLIGAQLVKIHFKLADDFKIDEVELKEENSYLIFYYKKNKTCIEQNKEKLELNLEKLRVNRNDDLQAITAVHESGHIVLSLALMQLVPEYAFSVTADADSGGFMYAKSKTAYISKKQIINRAATLLGGYLAEKLLFGEDNVTNGSESDLYKATSMVSELINQSGMGNFLGAIQVRESSRNEYLFEDNVNSNKEVMNVLQAAATLAEQTLLKEKDLLLKLADYLSENRMIKKEHIKEITEQYAISIDFKALSNETNCGDYKGVLKQQVLKLEQKSLSLVFPDFCLNQNILTK